MNPLLPSTAQEIGEAVAAEARRAGFSLAGIAPVPLLSGEGAPQMDRSSEWIAEWIERGYAGEMEYLKRRDPEGRLLRSSARIPFPWARSVIVCAANYHAGRARSIDPAGLGRGWIAQYAWSGSMPGSTQSSVPSSVANVSRTGPGTGEGTGTGEETGQELAPSDYHDVLLARLKTLDQALQRVLGPFESRCYVDTGPVVERVYAQLAGIGWTGKNTCTIHPKLGSWLFLGVILTAFELPPERPLTVAADRCGSCTRCIDACPTGALVEPYRMDASLCISYLTIEKRGAIPQHLRSQMGRQVFGCDICQEVCPWNRRAPISEDAGLAVRSELINPALEWLAELDAEGFRHLFRHSPLNRAKLAGLQRNVAIAMGNSGLDRYLPRLREWSQDPDPVLAEAASWAIGQLRGSEAGQTPTGPAVEGAVEKRDSCNPAGPCLRSGLFPGV